MYGPSAPPTLQRPSLPDHVNDRRNRPWFGTYRSRAVRVVLVGEPNSSAKAGYDLALITTDLHPRRSPPNAEPTHRGTGPNPTRPTST